MTTGRKLPPAPAAKAPERRRSAAMAQPVADKLESDIKGAANAWAILRGWWTIKIETPTMNGVPDQIYVRRGVTRWVEWKKPDGTLSVQQQERIHELTIHGAEVKVFDNIEDFQRWMY